MDRPGLPSQRRLHAGAVLSLLRYGEPGPSAAISASGGTGERRENIGWYFDSAYHCVGMTDHK